MSYYGKKALEVPRHYPAEAGAPTKTITVKNNLDYSRTVCVILDQENHDLYLDIIHQKASYNILTDKKGIEKFLVKPGEEVEVEITYYP